MSRVELPRAVDGWLVTFLRQATSIWVDIANGLEERYNANTERDILWIIFVVLLFVLWRFAWCRGVVRDKTD